MSEDKIEGMLSQLIRMVGNIQSEQQEMKQVQQDMQGRLQSMEGKLQDMDGKLQDMEGKLQDMDSKLQSMESKLTDMEGNLQGIEEKGEERHQEVLGRFKALEIDQDFIWEKVARNEREIGTIKRQLN
jgi:chromosome segregation ATPase